MDTNRDSAIVKHKSINRGNGTTYYAGDNYEWNAVKYKELEPDKASAFLAKAHTFQKDCTAEIMERFNDVIMFLDDANVKKGYKPGINQKRYKYEDDTYANEFDWYFEGDRLILYFNYYRKKANGDRFHDWYFIKGYTDEFDFEELANKMGM